jgi:hypothetical protein
LSGDRTRSAGQLAVLGHELRRVAHPAPVRSVRRELPVEQVRRYRLVVVAHRGDPVPLPDPCLEPLLLHDPDDPLAADEDPVRLGQLDVDARAAVRPAAALVGLAYEERDAPVLDGPPRGWTTNPCAIAGP